MSIMVFWVVTTCSLVDGYQRYSDYKTTRVTIQKTAIHIFTAVKT